MKVQRGYKTEINPNDKQKTLLLKNAGAARWAYNYGLSQKKAALEAKTKIPNVNKDERLAKNREYYQKNYDRIKQKRRERMADPVVRLRQNLRNRLNAAIKNKQKSGSAVRDLGCAIEEFIKYIESKFQEGMTWENWGRKGWHLDHIKPLIAFDLTDRQQFLEACHYTNIQPMWYKDNLSKGSKMA